MQDNGIHFLFETSALNGTNVELVELRFGFFWFVRLLWKQQSWVSWLIWRREWMAKGLYLIQERMIIWPFQHEEIINLMMVAVLVKMGVIRKWVVFSKIEMWLNINLLLFIMNANMYLSFLVVVFIFLWMILILFEFCLPL